MKKNMPACEKYNQIFATKYWLKKHNQEEHTELWWNYCGKMFRSRKEVDNHMYEALKSTCHECTSKDEVDNYKEDIAVEQEQIVLKQYGK